MSKISLSSAIREGLHEEMLKDENVICIGEDIGCLLYTSDAADE